MALPFAIIVGSDRHHALVDHQDSKISLWAAIAIKFMNYEF
ncbi:hypothetical protein [Nostoc sphaeroides]|uniref:Uncharacterized protein n=1 Tax=Nostoc sphaeroides CCNUC1 TaxID=2653204 RepID=A0A5P8VRZ4_9NOSO|nr:hypothetical protein [Nostoc sphaeroides]QFS42679.1 hypothetical protein GXM_00152 [Nostoc sphaeroides CCNUC1]